MADALQGLATGNREDKAEKREQQILTPKRITDFVRAVFGGEITMDPCAAVDDFDDIMGFVDADRNVTGTNESGLVASWEDRTYCNPPFADLKVWLAKVLGEAYTKGGWPDKRIAVLCPARSNRVWWREARSRCMREGTYVDLNPFPFVGFERGTMRLTGKRAGTFREGDECAPMAMCLMFFNVPASGVVPHLPKSLGEIL